MTSREIAELTSKRHDNVMRTYRDLIDAGVCPQIEETPYQHEANGQTYTQFLLSKRDSLVLVARLSPEFTGRVVDRWIELESAIAAPAFVVSTTLSGALRLAAEQAEVIEAQAAQLAAAAPSVAFVEKYADATGTKGFRQVAKLLQVKENVFREFLIENKIMYRLGAELTPMAQHIDAGRFVVKAGKSDGGHAYNAARFTTKGITWIAGEYAKHQVAQHH
ncbi:MAG: phage antirepressor KilAC domain-containing protein [Burkholderiaceae bacterium]|nr:phage antirepressor KilAC domain-containing protein [Burkholderiaceae bacterium]